MNFKYSLLAGAVLSAVSAIAHADDGEITKVVVTANPFHQGETEQILLPAKVLSGDELRDKMGNSLGETLSSELGVSSSAFGAGSSRPPRFVRLSYRPQPFRGGGSRVGGILPLATVQPRIRPCRSRRRVRPDPRVRCPGSPRRAFPVRRR